MKKYIDRLRKFYTVNDLKKYIYTDEIFPFIQKSLEDIATDGYELVEALLKEETYKKGKYYSFIPKDKISNENLYNFNYDFDMLLRIVINNLAANFIIEHLNSDKDAICIAHGGISKDPTDGWIKNHDFNYPSPTFIRHKDHLYFLLNNGQKSIKEAEALIHRSSSPWPRQMIYFTYSSKLQNIDTKMSKMSDEDIMELAQNTKKMLINAYDSNWYIFWNLDSKIIVPKSTVLIS